jgi:hypothetical protein
MGRREQNTAFTCTHCGRMVEPCTNGSYRNHCPHCLWSQHVDVRPGDRASDCGGQMRPVGLTRPRGKDLAIVHECVRCGHRGRNQVARDTRMPDDWTLVAAPPPA